MGVKRAERVCSPWRDTFQRQAAVADETALFVHPMIRVPLRKKATRPAISVVVAVMVIVAPLEGVPEMESEIALVPVTTVIASGDDVAER